MAVIDVGVDLSVDVICRTVAIARTGQLQNALMAMDAGVMCGVTPEAALTVKEISKSRARFANITAWSDRRRLNQHFEASVAIIIRHHKVSATR